MRGCDGDEKADQGELKKGGQIAKFNRYENATELNKFFTVEITRVWGRQAKDFLRIWFALIFSFAIRALRTKWSQIVDLLAA
jgi:hypothetical protein